MNSIIQVVESFFQGRMSEVTGQQLIVVVLLLTLLTFLDNTQLSICLFGALSYTALRPHQPMKKKRAESKCNSWQAHNHRDNRVAFAGTSQRMASYPNQRGIRSPINAPDIPKLEVKRVSRHPVVAYSFKSEGFAEQVTELLRQIEPDLQSQETVDTIVQSVRQYVQQILPNSQVTGFCNARVTRATPFGVAVPEVDVVVTSSRQELSDYHQERLLAYADRALQLNPRSLQKSATRAIADRLVDVGGFKFRRSGFKCDEPKVTLMAPHFGPGDPVPVDLSINSKTPLRNAVVLEESAAIEPRTRSLVLLVKRWAKNRGICHAAKGHLPPYGWTLLVVYFLQVGIEDHPLLPPLQDRNLLDKVYKLTDVVGIQKKMSIAEGTCLQKQGALEMSVGALFSAFFSFYAAANWDIEVASVRLGRKTTCSPELRKSTFGNKAPWVEDPFECGRNVAEIMNKVSISRFHDELARVQRLLGDDAPLDEILEPWEPPE